MRKLALKEAASQTVIQDLHSNVRDLRSASESGALAAGNIAAQAKESCVNLQKAREHLELGRLFADTVNHCCDLLDGVASRVKCSSDVAHHDEIPLHQYTMESERNVHRAAMNSETLARNEDAPDSLPAAGYEVMGATDGADAVVKTNPPR